MSDALSIARFLQQHRDFFVDHADVFATLTVPHPYQDRVVSLGERQVLVLRDNIRELEQTLAELVGEARRNQSVSAQLGRWCQGLLAEADAARLPDTITATLAAQFALPSVVLRLWSPADASQAPWAAPASAAVRAFADTLRTPYCAGNGDKNRDDPHRDRSAAALTEVLGWLTPQPASCAVLALRAEAAAPAFGLLVLGADDPARFGPAMATDFLGDVAQLASAALRRLTGD